MDYEIDEHILKLKKMTNLERDWRDRVAFHYFIFIYSLLEYS